MNQLLSFLATTFPRATARIVYGAMLGPMIQQGLAVDLPTLIDALNNVAALARGETVEYVSVSQQELAEGLFEVVEPALAFMKVPLSVQDTNQVLNALATRLGELHPAAPVPA